MVRLDELNLRILQMLQRNARVPVAEIAQALGRSESTVRERIGALEMDGFLIGYQARVDWGRAGLPQCAVIRASCDLAKVGEVARKLAAMPNVTQSLLLTGPRPIMAILSVRDVQHLHSLLVEHIGAGPLTNVEAEMVLESIVGPRPPAPPGIVPGADLLGKGEGGVAGGAPVPRRAQA